MANKNYVSLNKLSIFFDNLKSKFANQSHTHSVSDIGDYTVDSALSPTSINPVQNKAIDAEFEAVASSMNALELAVDGKSNSDHKHDSDYDAIGSANAALATAKEYTNAQVSGLASTSSVEGSIGTHNTSTSAHNDIRVLITDLTTKLNNFLDVDDSTSDQLSEVLTLIENNKGTLESLTTSKVNVSDIIDNLTTNVANKPLSAAQGVALKALIDAIIVPTKVSELTNDSGYLTSYTETDPTVPSWAKASTKPTYTASEVGADASGSAQAVQSNLDTHISDKNNPHGVALSQLGVTATAAELNVLDGITATVTELNYVDGVTSNIQTQLNKKANDFSIEIYNGTGGNPKPVRFASFNYSTCGSENGIAAKISLVSGHGNGTSYAFLEDAIIRVSYTGSVEVDNFKYYGASTGTYDGANRQYGDIFWLIDTTNKIVDFYVLMGQYARVYQTPWKRLTYSSGGSVTQHTSCTVYSSGTKAWANNSDIALMSDIPTDYATSSHTHTKSQITDFPTSMTPTAHNQAASTITAGTFAGQVVAKSGSQAPGTSLIRNIKAGTSDLTAGSSSLATGELYFVYE